MTAIPFIDLAAQQRRIRPQLERRIAQVLAAGDYIMGAQVSELEARLCDLTGASHCISCSSGSDALLMALMAWGVGPGDAVFVPAFTFFATAEMPALLGATPVFVDIDPRTFLMDPGRLEAAIGAVLAQGRLRPAAVIPVDLFGQPAQAESILPLAQKYGLHALEDAAQSLGSSRHGRKAGALGYAAAATSFFPAKPLGCYGDGGAIFTEDAALAEVLRSLRVHGKGADKYENIRIGINGRLDTLQAAVLLAKLDVFASELEARERAAALYRERLMDLPELALPVTLAGSASVYAQFSVLAAPEKRAGILKGLARRQVPAHIYYPAPLPLLPVFAGMGWREEDFPVASAVSRRIFSLPFHPYLDEETIDVICQRLGEACRDND